jgi:phospholipid N-methyltransferase
MITFFGEAIRNFYHVGAVWPSSPLLAKALVRPMRSLAGPRRVLEVGAGTGAVTRAILAELRDGDHFSICEINEAFCRKLEVLAARRRSELPNATIEVVGGPFETAPLDGPFDFVICGLPFNNFSPRLMRQIFRQMLSLLSEQGTLTYFEYAGVRLMRTGVTRGRDRRRLRRIEAIGRLLHRDLAGRREIIFGNFPPAMAIRLTRNGPMPRFLRPPIAATGA